MGSSEHAALVGGAPPSDNRVLNPGSQQGLCPPVDSTAPSPTQSSSLASLDTGSLLLPAPAPVDSGRYVLSWALHVAGCCFSCVDFSRDSSDKNPVSRSPHWGGQTGSQQGCHWGDSCPAHTWPGVQSQHRIKRKETRTT